MEAQTAELIHLAEQRAEQRVAEAQAQADQRIEETAATAHDAAERTKRMSATAAVIVVLVVIIGATWAARGVPGPKAIVAKAAVIAASILAGIKFCTDRSRSWRSLLGGAIAVALAFLPSVLG